MEFFLGYSFLVSGRYERRPLEAHDVARARGLGADWLIRWKKDKATTLGAVASLGSSGIVPLVGVIAFGWSATLIVLAILIDVTSIWLTDLIKVVFASGDVAYQLALSRDTYEIHNVAVATSTRHAVFVDGRIDLDAMREPPEVTDYILTDPPARSYITAMTMYWFFATGIIAPWLFLMPSLWAIIANAGWISWLLLATPALIRVAATLVQIARSDARRATVALFPGAYLSAMIVVVSVLVSAPVLVNLPNAWAQKHSGAVMLCVYALVNLLIARIVRRSMQQREKVIAAFLKKHPPPAAMPVEVTAAAISSTRD